MQPASGCGGPGGDSQHANGQEGSCGQQECGDSACGGGGSSSGSGQPAAAAAAPALGTICMKCHKAEAQVVARGREPLCHPCLHEQLLGKVRTVVRVHGLIQPGDRLALAFSAGRASAVLLRFLAQLRNPRTDRPARGKVVFTLHVLHVDESAAAGLGEAAAAAMRAAVAAAVRQYCEDSGGGVQYHCIPLEAVFEEAGSCVAAASGDHQQQELEQRRAQQRERMRALLAAVPDVTGRADLARHLRARLLLRAAGELGCARLARGDCASALAAHIVASASKGCGYSLPGDIHLVDARHGARLPSVMLPLREVSARELVLLCDHWQLPLAQLPSATESGAGLEAATRDKKKDINALAATFVAGLEAHNPGSVPNILNTISKLQAFPWNVPAQAGQQQKQKHQLDGQQQQQQQQQLNGEREQQQVASVLCPICLAPLADDELPGGAGSSSSGDCGGSDPAHTSGGSGMAATAAAAGCCLSCCMQVLGRRPGATDDSVLAAMPEAIQQQMAALAAAFSKAAVAAGATGGASPASSSGAAGAEPLRAQVAEFLLE